MAGGDVRFGDAGFLELAVYVAGEYAQAVRFGGCPLLQELVTLVGDGLAIGAQPPAVKSPCKFGVLPKLVPP